MTSHVLIILAALAIGGCVSEPEKSAPAHITSGALGALVIAYRPDSADTFTATFHDSISALAWLESTVGSREIPFSKKEYPFGTLVEQIGPRRNGAGGYWLYKVNGKPIPESAGAHRVAFSDTVTFFFDER